MKKIALLTLPLCLAACQSTVQQPPISPASSSIQTNGEPTLAFEITGKIGITTQTEQGKQAITAFYAWGQENQRFAIDLIGAMGLGTTQIRYDGQTATLTSEKTGVISASSPEELLLKATGLHAPISNLSFWIVGKNTASDSDSHFENNRLTSTKNGKWTATFDYADSTAKYPNRLKIDHTDGHRVVLLINH